MGVEQKENKGNIVLSPDLVLEARKGTGEVVQMNVRAVVETQAGTRALLAPVNKGSRRLTIVEPEILLRGGVTGDGLAFDGVQKFDKIS